MDKKGNGIIRNSIVIILLIFIVLGLFDYFVNLNKEDISGGVVNYQGSSDKGLELKQLTDQLTNLNSDFKSASPQTKILVKNNLAQVTKQRKELMLELIEKDPKAVLKNALKQEVIDPMPDDIKKNLEKRVSKEGVLEVLIEDDFENNRSKTYYYLNENGKRSSLHFADQEPFGLISGTKVKLSGLQIDDKIALYKNPIDEWHTLEVLSTPSYEVLGEKKFAVVLVNFIEDPYQPITSDDARSFILNDENSANAYYKEVSYNRLWLSADIYGWYHVVFQGTDCRAFFDEVIEAADNDIDFTLYDGIVVLVANPRSGSSPSCTGIGGIGLWHEYTADGEVWLYGSIDAIGDFGTDPASRKIASDLLKNEIIHEMGHSFGFLHANAYECGSVSIGSMPPCSLIEYGDEYDAMGSSITVVASDQDYTITEITQGHINSINKEKIGWFDEDNIMEVSESGSYKLKPLEIITNDIQLLKIPMATQIPIQSPGWGTNGFYLEYRQPRGFDSFLSAQTTRGKYVYKGIQLRFAFEYYNNHDLPRSQLIDTTPSSNDLSDISDAALTIGKTFYDPYNQISITPTRLTEDGGIEVEIDFNRFEIKGQNNENVAYFDMLGNIVLKGTCQVQSNCNAPVDSFILKNANNEVVSYIDSQGNLCIETGDCLSSASCTQTTNDEFIVQDETGKTVSKIDLTNGDLCYTGRLTENGNI